MANKGLGPSKQNSFHSKARLEYRWPHPDMKEDKLLLHASAPRAWNTTLPVALHDTSRSIGTSELKNYYAGITSEIYDPDCPQTLKSVCINCNRGRPLPSLSIKLCCIEINFYKNINILKNCLVSFLLFLDLWLKEASLFAFRKNSFFSSNL